MGHIGDATGGRLGAAFYDWFLGSAERAGLSDLRRDLVSSASGRTIEIGAGTGLNLAHYPEVTELVLTEPDRHMARRLRDRVSVALRVAKVVQAPGEKLPFPD